MVRTRTEIDACRGCRRPFTVERPRAERSLLCVVCRRAAKRAARRAYYERHNAYRLGLPSGRKLGQANAAEYQTEELAARIAEANDQTRGELEQLPRQLQRVCEFCVHWAVDTGLVQRRVCERGHEPHDACVCNEWEPAYRTDDDDE